MDSSQAFPKITSNGVIRPDVEVFFFEARFEMPFFENLFSLRKQNKKPY